MQGEKRGCLPICGRRPCKRGKEDLQEGYPCKKSTKKQIPMTGDLLKNSGKVESGFLLDALHSFREARNLAGGLAPVNSAFAGALVKHRSCSHKGGIGLGRVFFHNGKADGLHNIFNTGADRAIAGGFFQALLVALDGRSMVGQGNPSKTVFDEVFFIPSGR